MVCKLGVLEHSVRKAKYIALHSIQSKAVLIVYND